MRTLAGVMRADHPHFLKLQYNGPRAMEELAGYDPERLIVGILGGAKGTTRDTFELIFQAEKYGARVALFGRKINLAEDPHALVRYMRAVVEKEIGPGRGGEGLSQRAEEGRQEADAAACEGSRDHRSRADGIVGSCFRIDLDDVILGRSKAETREPRGREVAFPGSSALADARPRMTVCRARLSRVTAPTADWTFMMRRNLRSPC